MSSDHSTAPTDLTAARIAAIAAHVPAHPTSLGMQVLAEDKLRMRMKIQQQSNASSSSSNSSSSNSSSTSGSKKMSQVVVVNALGWILNEWVQVLESRRRSGKTVDLPTNSPAFISRLREIARGLLADPNAGCGPVEAVAVHDAGTAIPASDLDAIIARIPNPVGAAHPIIDGGSDDGDDDDFLTEEQRLEEEELIEVNRRRKAEQIAQGIVHDTVIPLEVLGALDEMLVPP